MAEPRHTVALLGVGRIGMMHARLLLANPLVGRLVLADVLTCRAADAARGLGCDHAAVDLVFDPANPLGLDGLVGGGARRDHPRRPMSGLPSACTAEDALEALRIALACNLSRDEHRPVRLTEIS